MWEKIQKIQYCINAVINTVNNKIKSLAVFDYGAE